MELEKNMMKSLFVNVFSSIVCDVILQEQKDKHVNQTPTSVFKKEACS